MEELNRRYRPVGTDTGTVAWTGWADLLLGAWVLISPFFTARQGFYFWNNLVMGVLAALVSFPIVARRPFQGWLGGLVGVWLVASAWIPSLLSGAGSYWNNFIAGILLLIAGGSGLSRMGPQRPPPLAS